MSTWNLAASPAPIIEHYEEATSRLGSCVSSTPTIGECLFSPAPRSKQHEAYCDRITGWLTADEWVNDRIRRQKTEEDEPMYHQIKVSGAPPSPPNPLRFDFISPALDADAHVRFVDNSPSGFSNRESTGTNWAYQLPLPTLMALNFEKAVLLTEVSDLQARVKVAAEVKELKATKAQLTETLRNLTQPAFNAVTFVNPVSQWFSSISES